ncbi:MAG: VWA domain-containing protein [Kiritimatiellaeota bacterium]|nr:VWA domain-containing protein [Kiritimatiellota bacterium]
MNHVFWSFDLAWWKALAALLAVAAVALLGWRQVQRERERLRRGARAVEWLRVLAVLAFACTLFKPERVRVLPRTERPQVLVLCDASGSMATRDVVAGGAHGALSRADWLAAQRARKFWAPLENRYDVRVAEFATPPTNTAPAAIADAGTDLNGALELALRDAAQVRAVLLVSDGDWNAGPPPVTAATRLRLKQIPVFAVAAGSDQFLPDLELQSVSAPAYGLMEEQINLPFTIQSHLNREVSTTLTLEGPRGVVVRKPVVLPPMAQMQGALVLTPDAEGEQTFTVRLPVEPEETRVDNNARSFRIALRREILRVLLIETKPRWEYRYLRNALLRDPGVRVNTLLLHPGLEVGGGREYLAAFPAARDELSKYDVVFLGDIGVGPGELTEEQAQLLKGLVEQQASGLVFLPGRDGRELTLVHSALGDLLPVTLDAAASRGHGFGLESRLALTTRGRDHLLTMLGATPAENEALWRGLPGFFWYAPVLRARPGADVLAVHSEARNQYGRLPLLVARPSGNGRVLFMGTDAAWRWRRGVEDTYHYRFWGQVIRWMAHQRHLAHAEGLRFFYAPEAPDVGDRVFLHATAFDAAGQPLAQGTVRVCIRAPSGRAETLDLTPEPGGWGVSTGGYVPRAGGAYAVEAQCVETGRKVAATLHVHQPQREQVGRPARPDVLREIAAVTEGEFGAAAELDRLVARLNVLPERRPEEEIFRLWCHPLWLGFIVALLSAHWVGRKWLGRI